MISIAIGSDEAGFPLKETIKKFLEDKGYQVTDYGAYDLNPVLYPNVAKEVALAILGKKQERGILICGTGIGMAMTANKIPGIRAAQCHASSKKRTLLLFLARGYAVDSILQRLGNKCIFSAGNQKKGISTCCKERISTHCLVDTFH